MNIRKTFLLVLIIAIASLGLTLNGCKKKSSPPPASPDAAVESAANAAEDAAKAAEDAAKEAEKTAKEAAPAEHPQ